MWSQSVKNIGYKKVEPGAIVRVADPARFTYHENEYAVVAIEPNQDSAAYVALWGMQSTGTTTFFPTGALAFKVAQVLELYGYLYWERRTTCFVRPTLIVDQLVVGEGGAFWHEPYEVNNVEAFPDREQRPRTPILNR